MLTWPAPERNKEPILQVLRQALPAQGTVLEIASGTGQHIVHFAAALPHLQWQPTDPEAVHRQAIAARIRQSVLSNVASPLALDVLDTDWPVNHADAVVCINMIHIAPWTATLALLHRSAKLLPPGGLLYLYGPFRRHGAHTAPSNEAFDADLRHRNPAWGVRDLEDVVTEATAHGLVLQDVIAMPANNLSVLARLAGRESGA